jgi:glutamyl-tRNA synthetase
MFPGVCARFAPSPTGSLHVGNARLALLNWLCAHRHGGKFILRIDDTDATRCKEEYVQSIRDDLRWLGVDWDDELRQSKRKDAYDRAIQHLKDTGRLYACYETPEELEEKRRALLAAKKPPIYDRSSLHNPKAHDHPHWRFLLKDEEVRWNDCVWGPMSFQARNLSDPIVVRADGSISYMLASVVDDNEYFVSHILRGADHLPNTPIQAQMKRALDAAVPTFGHFPLISDVHGHKFSKRAGSGSVHQLREQGCEPLAVCQALINIGSGLVYDGDLATMAKSFDMCKYSRSDSYFSMQMVEQYQEKVIQSMDYDRLPESVRSLCSPQLWDVIRHNVGAWDDVRGWHAICADDTWIGLHPEADTRICHAALIMVPEEPWDQNTWSQWVHSIKNHIDGDVAQKHISMTLRQALTGRTKGPKMDVLLPFIDPKCVKARLNQTSTMAPRSTQDI